MKTGVSGTWSREGPGAELQDNRLPRVLLLLLPSRSSQWSDKEELVEPGEEAQREGWTPLQPSGPRGASRGQMPSPGPWARVGLDYINLVMTRRNLQFITTGPSGKNQGKEFGHRKGGVLVSTE